MSAADLHRQMLVRVARSTVTRTVAVARHDAPAAGMNPRSAAMVRAQLMAARDGAIGVALAVADVPALGRAAARARMAAAYDAATADGITDVTELDATYAIADVLADLEAGR